MVFSESRFGVDFILGRVAKRSSLVGDVTQETGCSLTMLCEVRNWENPLDFAMPSAFSPFTQWAHNDARTADERYLIFLVCEACRLLEWLRLPQEEQAKQTYKHVRYEQWKEWYLNPLLLPRYDVHDTERAAAMAPWLTKFSPDTGFDKRKIGDAGAVLRFFPALETVELGWSTIRDISFVEALPNLRTLQIHGGELEDVGPLKHCASLRDLSLTLSGYGPPFLTPPVYWLDARPLGALKELERLTFSPNPAVLEGMEFPALTSAELQGSNCIQPDCSHLPEMPRLRLFKLDGVQSLRGISRFPELRHLKIGGPLRDFGDIGALKQLSCLEVDTMHGWPRDVSPLTALPELLWACFGGDIPRNYWPMTQAPRLHELVVSGVPSVKLEVDAINAALPPWDEVFSLAELRPRPPLRFVAVAFGGDTSVLPRHCETPGADFLKHPKLFHLEVCWMHRRALAAAQKAAGDAAAIRLPFSPPHEISWARSCHVELQTIEALQRLPAIVEALREAMASSPHPWLFCVSSNLRITEMEMTEQQRKWLRQIEEQSSHWDDDIDIERYRKTQSHLIETQFRLRMSQEEHEEPDPEDFVPPEEIRPESHRSAALTPAAPKSDDDDDAGENPDFALKPFDEQEQDSGDGDDDDGSGNVKTAPPPEPPPEFWEDPYAHPLAGSYRFYATLSFDTFYYHGHNYATVRQLMGREPDEYYPAPEKSP